MQNTNTEKRNSLKSYFHSEMEECRQSRLLLAQARDLRKQAKAHEGHQEGYDLLTQAINLTDKALSLRGGTRELTLALAFLNGTAYSRCETNPESVPNARLLTAYLKDCLPTEMQAQAKDLAARWLEGTLQKPQRTTEATLGATA